MNIDKILNKELKPLIDYINKLKNDEYFHTQVNLEFISTYNSTKNYDLGIVLTVGSLKIVKEFVTLIDESVVTEEDVINLSIRFREKFYRNIFRNIRPEFL